MGLIVGFKALPYWIGFGIQILVLIATFYSSSFFIGLLLQIGGVFIWMIIAMFYILLCTLARER